MSHIEFKHGPHTYRAGKLPAMTQLHVTRRLAPFLSSLMGAVSKGELAAMLKGNKEKGNKEEGSKAEGSKADVAALGVAAMGPLLDAVGSMPDEQVEYVINTCLSVVERKQATGGWAPAMSGGQLQFEDIDMTGLLAITRNVLQRDLAGFFGASLQAFAAGGQK